MHSARGAPRCAMRAWTRAIAFGAARMDAAAGLEPRQRRCRPALPARRSASMDVPCGRGMFVRSSRRCWPRRCCSRRWPRPPGAAAHDRNLVHALFRMARARLIVLGFLRARVLRRHRARQFPLALARLLRIAAAGARRCSLRWPRGWRIATGRSPRAGWSACSGITPSCLEPDAACAVRSGEVVSGELRRLGHAGRCRAREARGDARRDARIVADNFKDRRRTGIRARRSAASPCCRIRSIASMDARRNCSCGALRTIDRIAGRTRPLLLVVGASEVDIQEPAGAATTRCATASAPCRRRAWSTSTMVASVSCCSRWPPSARGAVHDAGDGMASIRPANDARRRPRVRRGRMGVQGRRRAATAWTSLLDGRRSASRALRAGEPRRRRVLEGLQRSAASARRLTARASARARCQPDAHWLGLRLTGRDGSIEDWSEQPITSSLRPSGNGESRLAQQARRGDQRQADERGRIARRRSRRTGRCPGLRT